MMSEQKLKGQKERFAEFFEEPTRESLRKLLQENSGESRYLDFKAEWPSHAALAKQIFGIANTEPGCLVIGVAETSDGSLETLGISKLLDKADVTNGLKNYLPSELLARVTIHDFSYAAAEYTSLVGKKFQVLMVEYSVDHTPYVSLKSGDGIRASAIYVRREGQTAEATHDELQRVINKRIEASYSSSAELDLKQHIEQLRLLYAEIPNPSFGFASDILRGLSFSERHPDAPEESFTEFIARMIETKKSIIAKLLGVIEPIGLKTRVVPRRARITRN